MVVVVDWQQFWQTLAKSFLKSHQAVPWLLPNCHKTVSKSFPTVSNISIRGILVKLEIWVIPGHPDSKFANSLEFCFLFISRQYIWIEKCEGGPYCTLFQQMAPFQRKSSQIGNKFRIAGWEIGRLFVAALGSFDIVSEKQTFFIT